MTVLYLLGVLSEFKTFKKGSFKVERLGKLYCPGNDRHLAQSLLHLALEKGDNNVAKALQQSLVYTDRVDKFWPVIKRIKNRTRNVALINGIAERLEWVLLKDALL